MLGTMWFGREDACVNQLELGRLEPIDECENLSFQIPSDAPAPRQTMGGRNSVTATRCELSIGCPLGANRGD